MHLLGKIFLGLTFVAGVAAVLLTGRLLEIRNARQQAYESAASAAEAKAELLATKSAELDVERRRSATVQTLWHQPVVVSEDAISVGATGDVAIDIGTDAGFGLEDPERQANPVYYAFAGGVGESVFVGPFVLSDSRQARSLLVPGFVVGEDETASWPRGPWRFWEAVPPSAPAEVARLRAQLDEGLVDLDARSDMYERQRAAIRQAGEQLEAMLRRLEGDPDAEPVPGSPEVVDGLVAALANETRDRDEALARLAELRIAVEQAYANLERALQDNREIKQSLADAASSRVARD